MRWKIEKIITIKFDITELNRPGFELTSKSWTQSWGSVQFDGGCFVQVNSGSGVVFCIR